MRTVVLVVAMAMAGCSVAAEDAGRAGLADGGGGAAPGMDAAAPPVGQSACPLETSGARLRARHLGGEDGARQFVGWFDLSLGVNCAPLVAEDGATRCLPGVLPHRFRDSDCTMPVAVIAACASPPSLVSVAVEPADPIRAACASGHRVYRAALGNPDDDTYAIVRGACEPVGSTPFASSLLDLSDAEDPAAFVLMQEFVE